MAWNGCLLSAFQLSWQYQYSLKAVFFPEKQCLESKEMISTRKEHA